MKLDVAKTDVSTSLVGSTKRFSIAESAEAFEILSVNLYEYPKLAVVRELVCNAIDAHVANGVEKPVEVTLPTQEDLEFVVEDFGKGMTSEEIDQVYTTYFASSKNFTNEQIGAFGLGSKAPFAYTNQFIVETSTDDTKRTYVVFRDADGIPSVTLSSTSSAEHTGTRIVVPIKRFDYDDIVDNFVIVYPFLTKSPKVTNPAVFAAMVNRKYTYPSNRLETNKLDFMAEAVNTIRNKMLITKSSKQCLAYNLAHKYGEFIVEMGGVAYGVHSNVFEDSFDVIQSVLFMSTRMNSDKIRIVHADIGEFPVSPSRETLSFKGNTTKRLFDKVAAETARFWKGFSSMDPVDTKGLINWLVDHSVLSEVWSFYGNWTRGHVPAPVSFVNDVLKQLKAIMDALIATKVKAVKVTRRGAKSFFTRTLDFGSASVVNVLVDDITRIKRGVFFVIDDKDMDAFTRNVIPNTSVPNYKKITRLLNHFLDNNALLKKIFKEDECVFLVSKKSYDELDAVVGLPGSFDLLSLEIPKAPRSPRVRKVASEKIFSNGESWYTKEDVLKARSPGEKVVYDVQTDHEGMKKTLLFSRDALRAKKPKKDVVVGYVYVYWKDFSASKKIVDYMKQWCSCLNLSSPFDTIPTVYYVNYDAFKKNKLYDDPKFEFSVEYFGKLIADKLDEWYSKMAPLAKAAPMLDANRRFAAKVSEKLEEEYANPEDSLFYRDAKLLLGQNGEKGVTRERYNSLGDELVTWGLNTMKVAYSFKKIALSSDEAFFKTYPMLRFVNSSATIDERSLKATTIATVVSYVAEKDGLVRK